MADTLWGLIIAAIGAAFGYGAKYFYDRHIERKRAEVKYVSDQIQHLYGPLYAIIAASKAAWATFRQRYRPHGAFFVPGDPPTEAELIAWRHWMAEVFMPLNRMIVDLILKNTHLIEGAEFPESFSAIISHVKPYEIVLTKWEKGDFSEHTAYTNYPSDLDRYVSDTFCGLKTRQNNLLKKIWI
jgi:hypothetical protein